VRLARGRHQSPDQGACVMELASMLADEPFSDHPRSVCPVIGAFLRAYNDGLPDDRRQDLYEYAAKSVGTAAGRGVRRARARLCLDWLAEQTPGSRPSRLSRMFAGWTLGSIGRAAARASRSNAETHRGVLRLVDEMIALGSPSSGATGALQGVGSVERELSQL
ncbi:MAG TPA: hypothetical protein VFL87_09900, partial [Thermoleophilaceae bacterium]|nr:hypothetical protein [Thermoleophilaceae bacterium]